MNPSRHFRSLVWNPVSAYLSLVPSDPNRVNYAFY